LVCGYVASCNILSTNSQASGSSLNCFDELAVVFEVRSQAQEILPDSEKPEQLFAIHTTRQQTSSVHR